MKKTLWIFNIFTIMALPALADDAATINISGTIVDNDNETLIGATATIPGTLIGTTADIDGKYELTNIPTDAQITFSYVGCDDITYSANAIPDTVRLNCTQSLDAVIVVAPTACNIAGKIPVGVKRESLIDGECYPSECITPRWELQSTGKKAKCVEQSCKFEHGTGEWVANGDTWQCQLRDCDKNYKENDDKTTCIPMADKCSPDDAKKLESAGASQSGLKKGTETCIALNCKCGYDLNGEQCTQWPTDANGKYTKPCSDKDLKKINAKSGTMSCNDKGESVCIISECIDSNYTHNTTNNTCDSLNKQPCTSDDTNATDAEYKITNGTKFCKINTCRTGYTPNDDGTKCVAKIVLSEKDSNEKIEKLKENAQNMRDKEQSLANRTLGAAGIGATGIGAMQAASAMAEQSADEDAETAMRAYLATFHCNYGDGKNIAGGETDIELPGGNELITLYGEYVTLANDLKLRKTALNMRPGIESEKILDSATSGLYDDVSIGKTSGAYASLARAIQNPDGPDAAAWAAMKEETAQQLKTGLITAGVGAVASLAGNIAINSGKNDKNLAKQIISEYDAKKSPFSELEQRVKEIKPEILKCPSDAISGTNHPDCTCDATHSKYYNPKTNTCDDCIGIVNSNQECTPCPSDKPIWHTKTKQCIAEVTTCTPKCDLNSDANLRADNNCDCFCINGFTPSSDGKKCTCDGPDKKVQGNQCVTIIVQKEMNEITKTITEHTATNTTTEVSDTTLPASSLFKLNSAELLPDAQKALSEFVKKLQSSELTNCDLTIKGYTDPIGNDAHNQQLSEQRATAVKNFIEKTPDPSSISSIVASGYGEKDCTCGTGDATNIDYNNYEYAICKNKETTHILSGNDRYAPCRRVEIQAKCKRTTTTTTTTIGTTK